ncbi:MAG: S9 family peptidase [Caldisericia bacterium]|nr:S9 family peptidase [Caldisericia bacterium]
METPAENDSDLYLWLELEDTNNNKVADWVNEKTKLTQEYLNSIPNREETRKTVEFFCNQPKYEIGISGVCVHGSNIFYLKNEGLDNCSKLYKKNVDDNKDVLLADPTKIANSDSAHLYLVSISHDGKYVGFALCKGGSDWCELRVVNARDGSLLPDKIEWAKVSNLEFFEEGFFYSSYAKPPVGQETTSIPNGHKLCYHKLNTPTSEDEIILDNNSVIGAKDFWGTLVSERYLVVRCISPSSVLWVCKDLSGKDVGFKKLFETQHSDGLSLIGSSGGKAYFLSFKNTPNGQIVSLDLDSRQPTELKTVIAESKKPIKSASCDCGKIFVTYLDDVKSAVFQFCDNGHLEHEIKLPFLCTARTSCGSVENKFTVVQVKSFVSPKTLFKIDLQTGITTPLFQNKNLLDPGNYEIRQVFYKSFDGTKIPMFIIGKKDKIKDTERPLVLNGYGAANVSNTPFFSYFALSLIENGGIYAVANIRGGGEYGSQWHKAGIKENRINCFKDFIYGAEFLISKGYTSKEQLAVYGGSNGGTLVAACMNMRPDLFKVVVSNSGLHDMLRFHKISFGSSWINEYGNPDAESDRIFLKDYSPIHNIKPETVYPAIIIPACENDDRVSPVHSFKLVEALTQNNAAGGPFLLRMQKGGGHQLRNQNSQIDEFSDILSFVLWKTKKLD